MAGNQKVYCPKILSHPPGKIRGNRIMINHDNSFTRLGPFPLVPATPDPTPSSLVLTKDIPLNPLHNTFVRLFLPLDRPSRHLSLLIYFHAGGFLLFSAASPHFHDFCTEMALSLGAVVASVDYRLAPENRLPAAYEDGVSALKMIAKCEDEWVRDFVDLSSCYLVGSNAGANIVYHVGGRVVATDSRDYEPLTIRGLVLLHATFGAQARSGSELRHANDRVVPLLGNDFVFELSLPIGADRDHEYCNQIANGRAIAWAKLVSNKGWKIMFWGGHEDPFSDRQKELAMVLKREGVNVMLKFDTGCHNIEFYDKKKARELFEHLKNFVYPPQESPIITYTSRL